MLHFCARIAEAENAFWRKRVFGGCLEGCGGVKVSPDLFLLSPGLLII